MTIWKFPFRVSDEVVIEMPAGARILMVDYQGVEACLWAMVNPHAAANDKRMFRIVGTGHHFDPTGLKHVASFQSKAFVWHMFEQVG